MKITKYFLLICMILSSVFGNAQMFHELKGLDTLDNNDGVNALCTDINGNVYAAGSIYDSTGMYVALWNRRTWSEFAGSGSLNPQNTKSIYFDKTGNLYAVYFGQIAKWNITSFKWDTYSFPITIGLGRIVMDNKNNIYRRTNK